MKNSMTAQQLVKTFTKNERKNKKTDINAVDGISLSVDAGEIVGILGANGAGKTTLLRMMSKLMKPTSGTVRIKINDTEITDAVEIKRHIGYLSNNTKLYGRFSTRELLQMLAAVYGIEKAQADQKIASICQILSMEEFIDNRIEKLSTGQTQRASISRCLIHDPQIYIFDEPTLGLDILSSAAIIEFMKKERDEGKIILYSTHYMEEAEFLCDRLVLLNHGKIISEGAPAKLKEETGEKSMRGVFSRLVIKEGAVNEH